MDVIRCTMGIRVIMLTRAPNAPLRTALIADWLPTFGGAEHVIAELKHLWPDAPIFTTVAKRAALGPLRDADLRLSGLQKFYRFLGRHELLLPWMPRAVEDFDLQDFEVIVSSSHAVGKGVIPLHGALHMCYCHTPMRYAWEMEEEYLRDFRIPRMFIGAVKRRLKHLRRWDLTTAKRVDVFLANSSATQERIRRIYGRESSVIPPPVNDSFFAHPLPAADRSSAPYLAVGRLVPYKRFDLLIEAANTHQVPLIIAGKGSDERRLKRLAGSTVTFLGFVPDSRLPGIYAAARALLFPQIEDAGVVPLEAMACGTPVIALKRGGALDTVREGVSGMFFEEQTVASLADALGRFSRTSFDPETIRNHARQFSSSHFRERILEELQAAQRKEVKETNEVLSL